MKPGDPIIKAMKSKKKQLPSPPSGFGKRVEGASTSNTRVGY